MDAMELEGSESHEAMGGNEEDNEDEDEDEDEDEGEDKGKQRNKRRKKHQGPCYCSSAVLKRAAPYYVCNFHGSDDYSGLDSQKPLKTFAKAQEISHEQAGQCPGFIVQSKEERDALRLFACGTTTCSRCSSLNQTKFCPNPECGQRVHVATKTCPKKGCKSAIPNVAPKPILREKEALERSLAITLSKLQGQDPSTAYVIIACTKKEQMLVESVKVMTFGLSGVRGGHLPFTAPPYLRLKSHVLGIESVCRSYEQPVEQRSAVASRDRDTVLAAR